MTTRLRLPLLSAALVALAAPALACMPAPMTPTAGPVAGEGCSQSHVLTEIRAVGLSPMQVLAGGLVLQDLYDGNGCYWEANLVVTDCAAGQMLVIGPDARDLQTEPRQTGIDRIAAWLEGQGAGVDLTAVAARAVQEGYAAPLQAAVGARLSINGAGVATGCACAG
jgi:hypothetical protein